MGPSPDMEMRMEKFARGLHDKWGIGSSLSPSCNNAGTGLLIFLSIYDRKVFFSRGAALESTITDDRIDDIISLMRPFFRLVRYGDGIYHGIEKIIEYLEDGPPSTGDILGGYVEFLILTGFVLFFIITLWWERKKKFEFVQLQSQLSRIDRDQALSLQGKYQCTSCPICLEDFQGVEPQDENDNITEHSTSMKRELVHVDENSEEQSNADEESPDEVTENDQNPTSSTFIPTIGHDGLPLKLLRCGHVFCKTCWMDYITTGHGDITVCPICKESVASPETKQTQIQNSQDQDESQHQGRVDQRNNRQLYQNERNFRLHRLQLRYPRFINTNTLQRWSRQNNRDLLSRDREFLDRNPMRQRRPSSTSSSSYGRSFSSGGGRSSGGRGGDW